MMEHSKLPRNVGEIIDQMPPQPKRISIQQDEHDTLKARSELLSLMTAQMDELLGTIGDSLTNGLYHRCNNTLRIAKELK